MWIIQLWPDPICESLVDLAETEGLAVRIASIVERIPAGNWMSYSEVAIVVEATPLPSAPQSRTTRSPAHGEYSPGRQVAGAVSME